ncbi:MAG: biotin--[acetyl-CoA-carboxylase] ligase [Syntrophobacterales bacterium]|nr:MAG: biotin--[acetyl-CoA-carboxylase] ligase [Syntrophobacterales bacterium]
MNLNKNNLEKLLSGGLIGKKIHYLNEVDSTNKYAWKLALNGAVEGEVVLADSQTMGRGRMGNQWQSPPGCNLYASCILRPSIKPFLAPQLTLTAGVAVAELLTHYCPGRVFLKWPNDVLIGEKKICGILTEMSVKNNAVDFIILGIGVNINMRAIDLKEDYRKKATSLKEETSRHIFRADFTASLFRSFEKWYRSFISEGFDSVKERWTHLSEIVGKPIEVDEGDKIRRGIALGINEYGALLFIDDNKTIRDIVSGDVGRIGD